MTRVSPVTVLLLLTINSCNEHKQPPHYGLPGKTVAQTNYTSIGEIDAPPGYERVAVERNSFSEWLRGVKLKKDPRIYLYNGRLKYDQSTQFAVLDMPVGSKIFSNVPMQFYDCGQSIFLNITRWSQYISKQPMVQSYLLQDG